MNLDLFDHPDFHPHWREDLCPGAAVLRGAALADESELLRAIESIARLMPFQYRATPGGYAMSVAMTNCGELGWVTDSRGYRYQATSPESHHPWPAMPDLFRTLAMRAAREVGFNDFVPDACLINRYQPGAKMSLHQDKDEVDLAQPIVSVSLGLPAIFQFGGLERSDKTQRVNLTHGDVVVWGGAARLRYHGVLPLKAGEHPLTGQYRFNLTFRKAR
ncbi:MAG: DNA oxidative demethylase AlkB [Rouxiella aceris]|jgi:alkylated DNA repair protein (DNA oxidative demethylase)|uniref:Alpha-ketoglutarate-dependent dioxygenase AlkB n=1 Tax=Rouxiella aceris TaxID=2703884 RepID=A0A848ME86_9GAMM|nr:DNA oxidative demethylase AlkB [Rouxiella aceris]MDR3434578.1 DNA oxidative demethylase AlkB [Rouxiella aceris]NMP25726.1 DNA oxidative demethylase AlkB [Rouxiella aceris]